VAQLGLNGGTRDPEGAEKLARRLDGPMAGLGVVFVLVVLGQVLAHDSRVVSALTAVGWALWCVFAGELLLRAYVARDQRTFWLRNWWQLVFLAVPFLRFARVIAALRAARVGAVVGAAVRGSRSAGRVLSSRLWWLGIVTVIVALASSQLLYTLGSYGSYGDALHAAAFATISGEPLDAEGGFARVMELLLAAYSVVVFAGLAAAVGAFFLRPEGDEGEQPVGRLLTPGESAAERSQPQR
jgi:voltage-gated potassium channel